MSKSALLPTVTAVRMAWAMTGKFSDDVSKTIAAHVEDDLKSIEDPASNAGPDEKSYVTSAVATIKSSLRSLDIVYKGRELNFKENDTLRQAYLDSAKDSLDFGNKAKDFLKSLPTMTIGAAGSVTVAQAIGASNFALWGIGLCLAGVGYGVQWWFVKKARRQTQILYLSQDYERDLYYAQYVDRVTNMYLGLFLDLERIHKRVYNENYEVTSQPVLFKTLSRRTF